MGKIIPKDDRLDFSLEVRKTENVRILLYILSSMSKFNYLLNINDIYDFCIKGVNKIERLLQEDSVYFEPLVRIKEIGVKEYFLNIKDGYKDLKRVEWITEHLKTEKEDIRREMLKYRDNGDMANSHIFEMFLNCFDNPKEMKEILKNARRTLKEKKDTDEITIEQYKDILDMYDRMDSIISYLKKKNDTEQMGIYYTYYKDVHESLKNLLLDLFYERNKSILHTPLVYLTDYIGRLRIDYEHVLLLYYYLKSVENENLYIVEAVLYYLGLEQFYINISLLDTNGYNKIVYSKDFLNFGSEKAEDYDRFYKPYFLTPKGYDCYMFEPKSIAQQAFIANITCETSDISDMVDRYSAAQKEMKERTNGILFDFLPKDVENLLFHKLATEDFPVQVMDGLYGKEMQEEFYVRRMNYSDTKLSSILSNIYERIVKPYQIEVIGSYIRQFCNKIDILNIDSDIFIYFVTPERVSIAVKEGISREYLESVFDERFLSLLKKVEKPSVEDLVFWY